ncbi:ABC transporter permease OS=Castellaniella sp OX=1955812 GN=EPN31_11445 PE=3 SV=1 [Castellaniella denitrificans]
MHLGWFPASGYGDPGAPLGERVQHLLLPAIVLGVLNSALVIRFTRASVLDILGEDYVRTARAKGLSEGVVLLGACYARCWCPSSPCWG